MSTIAQLASFYTPSQIAELLQVKRRTIYGWVRDKKLSAVRAGKRVRIQRQALEEFLTATK